MTRTIAIAGLGAAARTIHLPAYAKLADLRVVGGFDPAVGGNDFPFPVYPSLQTLLDETQPTILAVVTPPALHFEQALQGLRAGCHVFCEKPFTTTLREADQLIATAEDLSRWLVVNHEFRFLKTNQAVKNRIGKPDFGDLQFASAYQTFPTSKELDVGWRGEGEQRVCKEFGVHVLDLCRFFFDEDPIGLYARMPRGGQTRGPDYLDLIELEFSGDRAAHITLDRISRGPHRYLDMFLDGTVGTIETSLGGRFSVEAGLNARTRRPFVNFDVSLGGRARLYHGERFRKIASEPAGIFAQATGRLLRAFIDALDGGTVPPCHAQDARRSLALVLTAYASEKAGKPLRVVYE